MKLNSQGNKERRKSWLPQSNLLTSLFHPRQQQQSNDTTNLNKRRSHSLDQGNSLVSSSRPDIYRSITPPEPLHTFQSFTTEQPTPRGCSECTSFSTCTHSDIPQRQKHNNFVGSLFSKAKKHRRMKQAATLIGTTANHYKKSIKDIDKLHLHRHEHNNNGNNLSDGNSSTDKDDDDNDDIDDPLLVSLFGTREDDVDRMQQKNDLIRLAFAGEFTRPMDEQMIDKVLDIGCGPLCWSIDFAQTHPNAQVIGMDLVNMVPPDVTIPKNCQLLIHNCMKEFPFVDNSVDLCHVRFMNVALTMDQYCKMVAHCWRVLKPGGYLELMEMDMLVYSPGPVTEQLNQQVIELVRTLGLKPRLARYLKDVLPKDAVTDDHITEFYRSLPIGVWGGRLGVLFKDDLIYALTHARRNTADHDDDNNIGGITFTDHYDTGGDKIRDDNDLDRNKEEDDLFENQLLAAEKELEQCKSYSNFHFLRVQKPLL